MKLWEREEYLKKKFVGKMCCHRTAGSGYETIYNADGSVYKKNISSEPGVFKRVVKVEMTSGPPSGWTWSARLWYDDGTFSGFDKMGDIEVLKD